MKTFLFVSALLISPVVASGQEVTEAAVGSSDEVTDRGLRVFGCDIGPNTNAMKKCFQKKIDAKVNDAKRAARKVEDGLRGQIASAERARKKLEGDLASARRRAASQLADANKRASSQLADAKKNASSQLSAAQKRARTELDAARKKSLAAQKSLETQIGRAKADLASLNKRVARQTQEAKKKLDALRRDLTERAVAAEREADRLRRELASAHGAGLPKNFLPPVILDGKPEHAFDLFGAGETGANYVNAYLLSLLSWIAYAPEDDARRFAGEWGLEMASPIDRSTAFFLDSTTGNETGSTQAYVFFNDTIVVVTYRGSTSHRFAQDWIDNDLDMKPLPVPAWGLTTVMHAGFADAEHIVHEDVRNHLVDIAADHPVGKRRRLWLTGHSLGGAVAQIAAYRFKIVDGIAVQGVHVFGAPPVGNLGWANTFGSSMSNVHRWNLQDDPVPVLYQAPLLYHVGTTNNVYTDGHVVIDDPMMFGYIPSHRSISHFADVHMAYWNRMFQHFDPGSKNTLPQPPAGSW